MQLSRAVTKRLATAPPALISAPDENSFADRRRLCTGLQCLRATSRLEIARALPAQDRQSSRCSTQRRCSSRSSQARRRRATGKALKAESLFFSASAGPARAVREPRARLPATEHRRQSMRATSPLPREKSRDPSAASRRLVHQRALRLGKIGSDRDDRARSSSTCR